MAIHNIYKPLGWTPLDAVNKFREQYPEFQDAPITYAGRLDPMAEGVIVLLSNEDRHNQSSFQRLNKVYEATFLLGIKSDTYDCLGLMKRCSNHDLITTQDIESFLIGKHALPFPPYSSYRVKGKPLHFWARENRLNEVNIPIKMMEVCHVQGIHIYERNSAEVHKDVIKRIKQVHGDFRQNAIISSWDAAQNVNTSMTLIDATLTVTSGTYIRALAQEMGDIFQCGAVLFSLKRLSVGQYSIDDSMHLTS